MGYSQTLIVILHYLGSRRVGRETMMVTYFGACKGPH